LPESAGDFGLLCDCRSEQPYNVEHWAKASPEPICTKRRNNPVAFSLQAKPLRMFHWYDDCDCFLRKGDHLAKMQKCDRPLFMENTYPVLKP
jgi:hypothetical protein